VKRPFTPTPELTERLPTDEKIAEALEHIAVALSAIDHNIERLVGQMDGLLQIQAKAHR
jgi:hypothetical protein